MDVKQDFSALLWWAMKMEGIQIDEIVPFTSYTSDSSKTEYSPEVLQNWSKLSYYST